MRTLGPAVLVIASVFQVTLLTAQTIPARDDSRHSLLREAWLGLFPAHDAVPATQAGKVCVQLPKDEESEEIQGPHGDSLIASSCRVASFGPVDSTAQPHWMAAHYIWTSVYTAEDSSRAAGARDTAMEEEVVLFKAASPGSLIPMWHGRFETGDHAIWRSVTPEAWLDQLPRGFEGRIRHGVRIDPKTLRGEAGFYGDRDPNCCPSQVLIVHLTVRGDSLVLLRQALQPTPKDAS
jgi:hypothetical protein